MKKLTLALSLAIATIGLSGTAFATWVSGSAVQVASVQTMDYGDIPPGGTTGGNYKAFLNFATAPYTTTCANGSAVWRVGGGPDNIKNIISLATAAKLAGRTVTIYWNSGGQNQCDGSTSGGTTGYPVVIGLLVN